MNQDEPDQLPPPDASGLGRTLLVVSPEALAEMPALAGSAHLCVGPDDPAEAARALMRGTQPKWADDADTIIVVAVCEPLCAKPATGCVYHAVDYINALGDSPLIGIHPVGHESFFIDMDTPFMAPPRSADASPFQPAILAAWPAGVPLDGASRTWLTASGASVMASHGVSEAIAARATGKRCMALFCARGDREGTRSVLEYLHSLGICNPDSFHRIS